MKRDWTTEEDEIIRNVYPSGGKWACWKLMERSDKSIANRASQLGVRITADRLHAVKTTAGEGLTPVRELPLPDEIEHMKRELRIEHEEREGRQVMA